MLPFRISVDSGSAPRVNDFEEFGRNLEVVIANPEKPDFETVLNALSPLARPFEIPASGRVLIRCDFDVPLQGGKILDATRILQCLPSIRFLLAEGASVIVMAHIGRQPDLSLSPVATVLETLLETPVTLVDDWLDENWRLTRSAVSKIQGCEPGRVILLENARKYPVERSLWDIEAVNLGLTKLKMFELGIQIIQEVSDVFVHEAIASSNFDYSSTVLPLLYDRSLLGSYIYSELHEHLIEARRAKLVVISGLKMDKLNDLESILERGVARCVIIGGAIANAMLKAQARIDGREIFVGRIETDPSLPFFLTPQRLDQALRIIERTRRDGVELVLPIDFHLDDGSFATSIPQDRMQFDIGPESANLFRTVALRHLELSEAEHTPLIAIMNGVLGKFEDPTFEAGTKALVDLFRELTQRGARTYVGGGEGRMALIRYADENSVTHAFTAGGTIVKGLGSGGIRYLRSLYLSAERVAKYTGDVNLGDIVRSSNVPEQIEQSWQESQSSERASVVLGLLDRLLEDRVKDDPDLRSAICDCLVELGVLGFNGNQRYMLSPVEQMSPEVSSWLSVHRAWLGPSFDWERDRS